MAAIRLDKYLADMQLGTRSQVKEFIRKKRIRVNDEVVSSPDYKINTDKDIVTFDGKEIVYHEYEYFMLNKPQGVLSATRDKNTPTVLDLITSKNRKDLFPVGRLDKDTEGLLLITNDGALSHELLSPRKHVDKMYYAKVAGYIGQSVIDEFAEGLIVDSEFTAMPANLCVLSTCDKDDSEGVSEVQITVQEGKYHQIKRMFEAVGSEVLYLKRLTFGTLRLDTSLKPGEYRVLTQEEIKALQR